MHGTGIRISTKVLLPIFDLPQYVAYDVGNNFQTHTKLQAVFRVLCVPLFVLLNSRREDKLFRKVRCS